MHLKQKNKINIKEIALFGMVGALMYASKRIMEPLPNMHLIGVFIVSLTVVFRAKALYPIYIFIVLTGLLNGFGSWWIPYLYIWAILWLAIMLLPQKLNGKKAVVFYTIFCSLHGFLFGVLYAPFQAIMYNLDFNGTISWIVAGLPLDIVHGVSNLILGAVLITPMIKLFNTAKKQMR